MPWPDIAERMPGFKRRQLRERWCNYLSPDLKRSDWTSDEDAQLLRLRADFGPRWGLIGNCLGNRSGPDVKNRYKAIEHPSRKRTRSPGTTGAKLKAMNHKQEPAGSGVKKIVVADDPRRRETQAPPDSTTEFSIKNILAY
jgi:hypothetical protein